MSLIEALETLEAWEYGHGRGWSVTLKQARQAAKMLRRIPGAPKFGPFGHLVVWCRSDGWCQLSELNDWLAVDSSGERNVAHAPPVGRAGRSAIQ